LAVLKTEVKKIITQQKKQTKMMIKANHKSNQLGYYTSGIDFFEFYSFFGKSSSVSFKILHMQEEEKCYVNWLMTSPVAAIE
jgi:hypothetical protein